MRKTIIYHYAAVISFMPPGVLVGYYFDSFLIGAAVFSFGIGLINVGWFVIHGLKD